MIIDVNGYYGRFPYWQLRSCDMDDIITKLDQYHIDRVFLSSLKSVFTDPQAGNEEIKHWVKQYPERFYPVFVYSPYAAGKEQYKSDWEQHSIGFVKLFPAQHTYDPLEEPFIHELMWFCGENAVPVLFPYRLMMSWRFPIYDLKKMHLLFTRYPQTTFIIASINYLSELQSALYILQHSPNVYLETSAMMALREIEYVVKDIGSDRLLHGSCIPLQNPAIAPLKITKADISQTDKENILYKNVMELFEKKVHPVFEDFLFPPQVGEG